MSFRSIISSLGYFVVVLATALVSADAQGCLAEYRSLDWQIAHSPLVVIAEVVRVDGAEETPRERGRGGSLSVATLKILRVIRAVPFYVER